ncbi:MAG TPA: hypothetical protein VLD57_02935, partial [Blastocatellia bacterium]|nr:hypothetical protein [Blastocatellia bacterium]
RFDLSAGLLCDFTNDRSLVEQALVSYRPGYTESSFWAALSWANERLREQPFRHQLILISDLQQTGVAAMKPVELDGVDLRVIRIAQADGPNASLDAVTVRSFDGRVDVTTELMVSRENRYQIKPVSLSLGPVSRDSETTASNENLSLSARLIEEGLIVGRLTTSSDDAFDADDNRFFLARLPVENTLLIVQPLAVSGGHAGYIEKAVLAGLHLVSDINPVQVRETLPASIDLLRRYRAVICPARSIDQRNLAAAREYARGGGSLIVLLGIEDGNLSEQLVEGAAIASLDRPEATGLLPPTANDSPGLWVAERFRAARSISIGGGEVALRYSSGEPAATRVLVGDGSMMILGFGLSDKDTSLVRSPLFPQFVEWLLDASGRGLRLEHHIAGQAPAAVLLGGARKLTRIYSVDGRVRDEAIAVNIESLYEPGIYRVERAAGEKLFAINVPASESRLAQSSERELVDRIIIKTDGEPQVGEATALWWIAAVGALALSLVELAWCGTGMQAEQK